MRRFAVVLALLAACNNTSNNGGSGSGGGSAVDVRVTVSGSGRVTSTPAGIDCGSTCSASFAAGTVVGLTAMPNAGFRFVGWSGACTGPAGCQITSAGEAVTATFEALPPPPPGSRSLSVTRGGSGAGYVSSSPGGIDCGGTCSANFTDGAVVTLTAKADGGSTFTGWSGACSGTGACSVTMSSDMTVSAAFDVQGPPPDDCAGLVPAPPAEPRLIRAQNQDLTSGYCTPGESDGTGHIVTGWQNNLQPHETRMVFSDSTGYASGSYTSVLFTPIGQASGFMGESRAGAPPWQLNWALLDPTGHQTAGGSYGSARTESDAAGDPLGGIVMSRFESGTSALFVDAIDASGNLRWSRQLPGTFDSSNVYAVLGVDRQGNVLALFQQGGWHGQWFDHAGTAGASFALSSGMPAELIARVDNGLILRGVNTSNNTSVWLGQFEPMATTLGPVPPWLAGKSVTLHMVHGGQGYALLPYGAQATPCQQSVEIVSKSGKSCGSSTFGVDNGTCSTGYIRVGYDGTVVQQLPRDREAACTAAGHQCDCTYRFWPGYFK